MKKNTLILLMFMSICSVYGQAGLSLSIKGGAGISNFFNLKFFQEKDIMVLPAIGYSLGAEMGWNSKFFNFGITGGAYIRQYGHAMDNVGTGQLPEIHNYYKLNALELPLLIRFRPRGNNMTKTITMGGPYFEMGLQAVLIQNAQQKISGAGIDDMNLPIDDLFESMTGGLVIGFGDHQIGLEKFALTHGLRIHFNIFDITAKELRDNDYNGTISYSGTSPVCIQYLMAITLKFPS